MHIMKLSIRLFIFTLFFFLVLKISAQVPANQTGMKLFDDYAPDNTGKADVSELLQSAIDYCILNSQTLYISPGTYLVSKQIEAKTQVGMNCGSHIGKFSLCITGDAYNRPVIKLKDGATGFSDESAMNKATPVLWIHHEKGEIKESCAFWNIVMNLNFDLGNNPGAVALRCGAAQDAVLSNISVYGQNFAAGFSGLPGRNASTINCEVNGGKYAFYIKDNSLACNLFGIKCSNQTVAALYLEVTRGISIVGLEISGCKGKAIETKGDVVWEGNLVLTDARIEIENDSDYAFEINNRALVLKNVYVKGTNNLVLSTEKDFCREVNTHQWTKINSAIFTPALFTNNKEVNGYLTVNAFNLINNIKSNNPIMDIEYISVAPMDLRTRNLPDAIYSFNAKTAVCVTNFGAKPNDNDDDFPAFQKAINENDIVFVPSGIYYLSKPLMLKNNSVLLGDIGKRSRLVPTYSPSAFSWVITTPDIEGHVVIQDLAIDNVDKDFYGGIKWQTSNGFMMNVRNYLESGSSEGKRQNYIFTGNAGGKFYAVTDHGQILPSKTPSDEFRKIVINGTHNPITFYGLNIERGGRSGNVWQNPFLDATNCSNIRIYGSKSETDGIIYRFSKCNNISVNSVYAHAHRSSTSPEVIKLENGTKNVEINHVYCPLSDGILMYYGVNNLIKQTEFLGSFQMGKFSLEAFNK